MKKCLDCGTQTDNHWSRKRCEPCNATRRRLTAKKLREQLGANTPHPCERCGVTLSAGRNVKWCLDCRPTAYQEGAKARAARNEPKRKPRVRTKTLHRAAPYEACRCEICGTRFSASSVTTTARWDHNHGTGQFRGWLCHHCNVALGLLGDNPEVIEAAASYLRQRGCTPTRAVLL